MWHRRHPLVLVLGVLLFLLGGGMFWAQGNFTVPPDQPDILPSSFSPPPTSLPSPFLTEVKVIRVVDGDTIEIEGGEKVRYIGVDTPETVDPRRAVGCFGREAAGKNKELVEGQMVRLEKDISETDKFGRLLRYVWVEQVLVNDYLVRGGFAYASSYPPDIKYQEQFRVAEKEAREKKQGLWGAGC